MCLKCNLGEETQFIDEVTGKVETKQTNEHEGHYIKSLQQVIYQA